MSYSELIQVIGLSSLLTLAQIVVLISFGRRFLTVVKGLLPPRYLKSRGVRSRAPAQSKPHESA